MNVHARRIVVATATFSVIVGLVGLSLATAQNATTQPAAAAAKSFPFTAHVTGNNVRIRSGPDTNYYPVGKLSAGDEITVYSEEYGWMSIAPPKGSYSLIDRQYVDKAADGSGLVNGENVWVRAGSDMDSNRYAKQVTLPKGAQVKIIGETSDNAFYKIEPPSSSRVWVKSEFVKVAGKDAAPRIAKANPSAKPGTQVPTPTGSAAKEMTTGDLAGRNKPTITVSPTTQPSAASLGPQGEELNAIDAAIDAEASKALAQQNYNAIIDRLRPIASQDGESVGKIYAQKRMDQLKTKMEMIASLGDISTLEKKSAEEHSLAEQVRRSIKPPPESFVDGRVEARGELRPSQVFDMQSPAMPKRYRLVDPNTERTVAYVEENDKPFDMNKFLGRYVAVRANGRRLTAGTVQPISILLPDEIVVVEPKSFAPSLVELQNTAAASGQPVRAPSPGSPTTRPAPTSDTPTTRPAK